MTDALTITIKTSIKRQPQGRSIVFSIPTGCSQAFGKIGWNQKTGVSANS